MDTTVTNFYTKNAEQGYADDYDRQHGSRLDATITRFGLDKLKDKKLLDVGGGMGFLGRRLDSSNDYWVVDGAYIPEDKRLCKGTWYDSDLDYTKFSEPGRFSLYTFKLVEPIPSDFDAAFFFETLEHLSNPYNALEQIKKAVKPNGDIYLSIPHENVWHNTVYPGLLWPVQNFQQFLGQMALPIVDFWLWDKGWNAYIFKCRNASWNEKVMLYHKAEDKFKDATPVQMTNL